MNTNQYLKSYQNPIKESFFKMEVSLKVTMMLMLKLSTIYAAPLQFPLLQPLPGTWQQQQLALQEQMLALNQFQALQQFSAMPSPIPMNAQQPLLLLFPNALQYVEKDDKYTKLNENILIKNKPITETENNDDSDSITIDADPEEASAVDDKETPMRAILLLPNRARFSLGGFISSIPWLPIEVNVPDSISWIYEGISGIISGIGQSWPFNRPQTSEGTNENVKTIWKNLKTKKIMPIVVMPLG